MSNCTNSGCACTPNRSIHCTVNSCAHHCKNEQYCGLDTIPDLWARMLELQAIPNKATEKFNRTQKFSDIDSMFRQEDGIAALRQAA